PGLWETKAEPIMTASSKRTCILSFEKATTSKSPGQFGASGVGANASSNPFSRTLRLVLGNQISIPLCMIEASEVPVWKLHATERDVFYPSPFSLTVLIDGSNPGYIILFCTTSQVYSLECMHNGLTHHTV